MIVTGNRPDAFSHLPSAPAQPHPIEVAATSVGTRALGPGLRSVVWVQGCPFSCPGCIAPDWIPRRPARRVQPDELVGELLADPAVDGLTLSGGEPMLQAAGLAEVVRLARTVRPVSVITFTGYRLERLRREADPGVARLLAEVDVLVDGRYAQALDDGVGLRGSSNQRILHLTGRLRDHDLAAAPRVAEIRINDTSAHLVGVPPRGLLAALDDATARLRATGHVRGRPMHAGGEEQA